MYDETEQIEDEGAYYEAMSFALEPYLARCVVCQFVEKDAPLALTKKGWLLRKESVCPRRNENHSLYRMGRASVLCEEVGEGKEAETAAPF